MRYLEYLLIKFERLISKRDPVKMLASGYLLYMTIGFLLLLLPFSTTLNVTFIDNLFIAVSAVSTTGLVTIDTGQSYSFFGQIVILALIQLGGIGYMTFGSFIIIQTGHRVSKAREKMTRTAFPLPEAFKITSFLKGVIIFTVTVELLGALCLSFLFWQEGVENPVWSGIFHSVSAFCTAGFSLNSDSLSSFAHNLPINLVCSVLAMLGAMGFIVAVDTWLLITKKRKELLFTSKVILLITSFFLVGGTLIFALLEPTVINLPAGERLIKSFFQVMTSASTVGFNTIDIGTLAPHTIILLYFIMLFGASPSGTGGGLKSTTFSALYALVRSTLRRSEAITFMNRRIPNKRLQYSSSAFAFCVFIVGISIFILTITELDLGFEQLLFESISALGTVGLSTGITSDLSNIGKIVIICLMIIGRVGVLTFGLAISTCGTDDIITGDNDLVV